MYLLGRDRAGAGRGPSNMNSLKWEGALNILCEPRCYPINPKILGVGSTPLIHIFHRGPPTKFLAQTSGKTNALGGIYKQVAV
jgi:hypothetical protein